MTVCIKLPGDIIEYYDIQKDTKLNHILDHISKNLNINSFDYSCGDDIIDGMEIKVIYINKYRKAIEKLLWMGIEISCENLKLSINYDDYDIAKLILDTNELSERERMICLLSVIKRCKYDGLKKNIKYIKLILDHGFDVKDDKIITLVREFFVKDSKEYTPMCGSSIVKKRFATSLLIKYYSDRGVKLLMTRSNI